MAQFRNPHDHGTAVREEPQIRIGRFTLHTARRQLLLDGERVRVGDRALDILIALAANPGAVLSNQELREAVWPGTYVDESALRVHLSALRKVLLPGDGEDPYVVNVNGRGYQLAAPIVRLPAPDRDSPEDEPRRAAVQMVGRDEVLLSLALPPAHHRLMTLVGPGGIGKTMVAHAVAQARAGDWVAVDLSSVEPDGAIVPRVADALGIAREHPDPVADLVRHFRDRRCRLVLDTCEHVIGPVVDLVRTLLREAPQLDIVATSREPLQSDGEWVYRLPPLVWPTGPDFPDAATALGFSAVRLFVERAIAGSGGFILRDEDVPVLSEICAALDGIPLALELAAARVGLLGLRGLASRIGASLLMLKRGHRTAVARHQTLRANLDWSFALLSDDERALLPLLAGLRSGFDLQSAFAVAAATIDEVTVARCLASLIAKSLIVLDLAGGAAPYRVLATTRTYLEDAASTALNDTSQRFAPLDRQDRHDREQ